MSSIDKEEQSSIQPEDQKKPYQQPRILSREPLEPVAAVCTPAPPLKNSGNISCTSGTSS